MTAEEARQLALERKIEHLEDVLRRYEDQLRRLQQALNEVFSK